MYVCIVLQHSVKKDHSRSHAGYSNCRRRTISVFFLHSDFQTKMTPLMCFSSRQNDFFSLFSFSTGSGRPEGSHMSCDQRCLLSSKSSRKGNDLNFKSDKPNSRKAASHIFTHQQHPEENYSFI